MVVRAADLVQWLNAQSSSKSKSPAELHSGTLKLRTAEQLETSYQDFKGGREKLQEFLTEAEAVVTEEEWGGVEKGEREEMRKR
jgi:hypothetical protein